MSKIRFLIDLDGNINTQFEGFCGDTCMAEAERIARALADQGVSLDVTSLARTTAVAASEHPDLRERHAS